MADSLFPTDLNLNEDIAASETIEAAYKKAPHFNSETDDFIVDGSGRIVDSDEVTTYTQWCETAIQTKRYSRDAYTNDFGIDYDAVLAAKTHEEAEAILESEISEALKVDPYHRTNYVQNVRFEWVGADELHITVEVVALDNEKVTVDTVIKI